MEKLTVIIWQLFGSYMESFSIYTIKLVQIRNNSKKKKNK